MNVLSTEKRVLVVAALAEGTSINATCQMTGAAKHTVLNLLRDLGCASAKYHRYNVRGLRVRNLRCDEIWNYVGAKRKNVTPEGRQRDRVTFGHGQQLIPTQTCVSLTSWAAVEFLPQGNSCSIAPAASGAVHKSRQTPTVLISTQ